MPLTTLKILIVDDEPELLTLLCHILEDAGYRHCLTATTMQEALSKVRSEAPDLAILDVMLPDGDGFELLRHLRFSSEMPVIFLTAKDAPTDKLEGLGLGADDYIVKPFLPEELLLRLRAVLHRTYPEARQRLSLAYATIDFARAEVEKDGQRIPLTAKEFALLETLARKPGHIVTMDALIEAPWDDLPFGYENALNAHIRRVREKIERTPSRPTSLLTVRGLGYKLITEEPK